VSENKGKEGENERGFFFFYFRSGYINEGSVHNGEPEGFQYVKDNIQKFGTSGSFGNLPREWTCGPAKGQKGDIHVG
jgi:hypothetical protein